MYSVRFVLVCCTTSSSSRLASVFSEGLVRFGDLGGGRPRFARRWAQLPAGTTRSCKNQTWRFEERLPEVDTNKSLHRGRFKDGRNKKNHPAKATLSISSGASHNLSHDNVRTEHFHFSARHLHVAERRIKSCQSTALRWFFRQDHGFGCFALQILPWWRRRMTHQRKKGAPCHSWASLNHNSTYSFLSSFRH